MSGISGCTAGGFSIGTATAMIGAAPAMVSRSAFAMGASPFDSGAFDVGQTPTSCRGQPLVGFRKAFFAGSAAGSGESTPPADKAVTDLIQKMFNDAWSTDRSPEEQDVMNLGEMLRTDPSLVTATANRVIREIQSDYDLYRNKHYPNVRRYVSSVVSSIYSSIPDQRAALANAFYDYAAENDEPQLLHIVTEGYDAKYRMDWITAFVELAKKACSKGNEKSKNFAAKLAHKWNIFVPTAEQTESLEKAREAHAKARKKKAELTPKQKLSKLMANLLGYFYESVYPADSKRAELRALIKANPRFITTMVDSIVADMQTAIDTRGYLFEGHEMLASWLSTRQSNPEFDEPFITALYDKAVEADQADFALKFAVHSKHWAKVALAKAHEQVKKGDDKSIAFASKVISRLSS